jgi:cytochrome c oxidase subunit 3
MATTKNHDYHLVEPDPWPLIGAFSGGLMFTGAVMWFHSNRFGVPLMLAGLAAVLVTMYSWWSNTIREAHEGHHTPVVQLHLRYGMILFIASEVMFFLAWFWAFFDSSIFPSAVESVGGVWPPKGIEVMNPWGLPLLNTLILLCSGTTVTWAHHSLIHGDRRGLKLGLLLTVLLGITFTFVQGWEYAHAPFAFKGSIYGSTFFMATGFHGFHVFVGTIFLIVCLIRATRGDFTPRQHFGFEAAAWYWHFVDVVWLVLFTCIAVWGGWGAPTLGCAGPLRWPRPLRASARAAGRAACSRAGSASRRSVAVAGSTSPASMSVTGPRLS